MKIIDNRGLQPPQPMMRTLKMIEKIEGGQSIVIINDRRPMFLYEELEFLGYAHETEALDNSGFKITITKSVD